MSPHAPSYTSLKAELSALGVTGEATEPRAATSRGPTANQVAGLRQGPWPSAPQPVLLLKLHL